MLERSETHLRGFGGKRRGGSIYDVICVGSATIDVFMDTDAELIHVTKHGETEEMLGYPAGDKILVDNIHQEVGGGGTNTAVGFARMGFKTAYFGALAKDNNSEIILNLLKKENVEFIGPRKEGVTNFSVILDSKCDDRTILVHRGVSGMLEKKDVKFADTRWLLCTTMRGKAFHAVEKICGMAKKSGGKVAFIASSYLIKDGIKTCSKMLKNVDVLFLNKEEARAFLGVHKDIPKMLKKLKKYVDIPVITDGKKGASVLHDNFIYTAMPKKGLKIKETTGAGDAFSTGFISGLLLGKGVKIALTLGMLNAESVITHMGPKNLLLNKQQALKFLNKDNRHLQKLKF